MQLSKQESKYRSKLFYENGYRKSQQQDLDYFVKMYNVTYKTLYFKDSFPDVFMMYPVEASIRRIAKTLKKVGISTKDAAGNFKSTYNLLDEISKKWDEYGDYSNNQS